MRGTCKAATHKRTKNLEEEKKREVQVIWMDYMGKKTKGGGPGGEWPEKVDSLPTVAGFNRRDKGSFAYMVPAMGHDAHAIKMVA